jgi:hypothetical protein
MVPGGGIALSTGETGTPTPTGTAPMFPALAPGVESKHGEGPRECNPSAGIDTECIF